MHTKEMKRQLACHFTADQLRDKSDTLAQKIAEMMTIEDEKKQIATDFKNRLEVVQAEVKQLAHHIRQKFEFNTVVCIAMMDTPAFGKKTIQRTDTGEFVGEEFMTPEDRQIVMQFETDAANPDDLLQPDPIADNPRRRRFHQ